MVRPHSTAIALNAPRWSARLLLALIAWLLPAAAFAEAAEDVETGPSFARQIAEVTQGIAQGIAREVQEIAAAFQASETEAIGPRLGEFAWQMTDLALVIATTVAVFLVLRRLARGVFARAAAWARTGDERFALTRRGAAVLFAGVADLLVIVGAWLIGYALALFAFGEFGEMRTRQSLFLNAFLLIEGFKALLRVVFAARDDDLRLLPMTAENAAYWNSWLARLAGFIGYGLMLVVPILNNQLSTAFGRAAAIIIMIAAFTYALIIILQNRQDVRNRLEAQAREAQFGFSRTLIGIAARSWHLLAIAYFLALTLVTLLRPEDALPFMAQATVQSLVVIGGGVFVAVVLTQIIGRRIALPEDTRQHFPMLEDRLNAYIPNALKVIRGVIVLLVLALLFDAWSVFNFTAWLTSDAGLWAIGAAVSISIVLLLAAGIWLGAASWMEHRLNPAYGSGEPTAREITLLALFRNALAVTLTVFTTMIVLSELGINIGPLIAGAGVLGLAIGFGAQKLVQDVITGVFIQLENVINAGDVVTAGSTTGVVEKLTVRSVGIRDVAGTYHMIPFSSVDAVSNFSKDFAYHVGVYGVAYRENVDEVIPHLFAAYEELKADPDQARHLLDEFSVDGVASLGDSSVNIRVRIKTGPGVQWAVGRAYNKLVKKHLDAAGIEIPYPHTTVYFGEDRNGTATPARLEVLRDDRGDGAQPAPSTNGESTS